MWRRKSDAHKKAEIILDSFERKILRRLFGPILDSRFWRNRFIGECVSLALSHYTYIPANIEICRSLIDWLVCCLKAGPDLWKRMPLKCSITMVCTCSHLSWYKILSPFREKNVVVSPSLFHIFMPLANLWFIRLQG